MIKFVLPQKWVENFLDLQSTVYMAPSAGSNMRTLKMPVHIKI